MKTLRRYQFFVPTVLMVQVGRITITLCSDLPLLHLLRKPFLLEVQNGKQKNQIDTVEDYIIVIMTTLEDLRDRNPEDATDDICQEKFTTLCGGVKYLYSQTKNKTKPKCRTYKLA